MAGTIESFLYSNGTTESLPPYHSETNVTDTDISAKRSIFVPLLMFSCGFLFNISALCLLATGHADQRHKIFYKLMASLFLTDFIGICLTSPVVLLIYASDSDKTLNDEPELCGYLGFCLVHAGISTMSIVCAMSIERYICMSRPLYYRCKMSKKYHVWAISFSWLFAAVIGVLPLLGLGQYVVRYPGSWCFFDSASRTVENQIINYTYVTIGIFILGVTVYCNIAAIVYVFKGSGELNASQNSQGRSLSNRIMNMHMIVMNIGVTLVFTTLYGPLMIATLLFNTDFLYAIDYDKVSLTVIRMASWNQICDPLVYILVNRYLRLKVIKWIKWIFGKETQNFNRCPRYSVGSVSMSNGNQIEDNRRTSVASNRPSESRGDESVCSFLCHCLCDSTSDIQQGRSERIHSLTPTHRPADHLMCREPARCVIRQPSEQDDKEVRRMMQQT